MAARNQLNRIIEQPMLMGGRQYSQILSILRLGLEAIGTLIFLKRLITRGTQETAQILNQT
jgi:hypothetical protein